MKEAEEGSLDEELLALDLRRARRQLRLNRERLARKGNTDGAAD